MPDIYGGALRPVVLPKKKEGVFVVTKAGKRRQLRVELVGAQAACCDVVRTAGLIMCSRCQGWWHRWPCGRSVRSGGPV